MANLSITNSFTANTLIESAQVNTNFSDVSTWLNNRDNGTDKWLNMKVTNTVANPVDISSSAATTEVSINNTATDGDPVLSFELSGTPQFILGVDDGDDNTFKGGTTAIGTGTWLKVTSAGIVTQPLQSSFLVWLDTELSNVTGDGTSYTVIYDTEDYDLNADMALGTSTFTAPVDGKYMLSTSSYLLTINGFNTLRVSISTSNHNYAILSHDTGGHVVENRSFALSVLANMDANDTASIVIFVSDGTGTKTVDVAGGTSAVINGWFSGSLIN